MENQEIEGVKSGFESPPVKLLAKRIGSCMRCNERITTRADIGCVVKHLDGRRKGVICGWCAARPPKILKYESNKGKLSSRKGKRNKRSSRWATMEPDELQFLIKGEDNG